MITIKEMAEMLGISTTTVSNVINGKTSEVSQKTAEKVQKLLDEYDYVPNMNAKNLAQNHSRLIGIVLKRRKDKYENIFTDPFHGELLGALESAIREQGYYMMIYISEDIEEIVRNIVGWNTEGRFSSVCSTTIISKSEVSTKNLLSLSTVTLQRILPDTLISVLTMKRADT